ncbi:MAG: preprotein translocase subunit SecA [Candidatus Chisholmbacteria bacterium]|nr:preprotein translocase subunit SecA [Candidatus Chisholmbacteria bacterium]
MVFNWLSKLLDSNQKQVDKLTPLVQSINELEGSYKKLSDKDLKAKTAEFKHRLEREESLDDILPEAFAAVREASRRHLNLRHFDVQLMAGIVFHQGKVAEQKTGEGKTLSATLALYLNALSGQGVHLVTVNDYLAARDAGWMGPIFYALGVSVGVIIHDKAMRYDPDFTDESAQDDRLAHLAPITRQEAYAADITYGTNNEFGFDYLRDNMAQELARKVQRGHHFAIVDEVDSILIDEARTPLIISAPDMEPTEKYFTFAQEVDSLSGDTDYVVDEKLRTANLTDHGIRKIEKRLHVENLYEKDFDTLHHLEQALKAKTLFRRDTEYVVKDNQVIIVDEHTGRLMYGRRYSDGLHQAIEAKESVPIQQESRTLATISLQNYFRMYAKLAGMTGTAETEAEELNKIYKLEVVVVPTNQPIVRTDSPDAVYKTVRAKYAAVVKEVEEKYKKGQPVLIGTRSIDHNQIISQFLRKKKIPHNVLNAKQHEREAMILAEAGKKQAVTVATNIAGRGVDIVLGGATPDPPSESSNSSAPSDSSVPSVSKKSIQVATKQHEAAMTQWEKDHQAVVKLGGLHVIGTERHESRRIDNQLRGRSGRQGDPGSSRFYVALEDDIMRLFGGDQIARLMTTLKMPEDQPLESGLVSRAIEQAQTKVEGFYFDQRKRVVEYDDVMNKQREIIYQRRDQILKNSEDENSQELKQEILTNLQAECEAVVSARAGDGFAAPEYDGIVTEFITIVPMDDQSAKELRTRLLRLKEPAKMIQTLQSIAEAAYDAREKELTPKLMRQVEKFAFLSVIDNQWMDHLDNIEGLREGIGLRGYAQKDPLIEYKAEAFDMFQALMNRIDYEMLRRVLRIQVQKAPEVLPPLEHAVTTKDDTDLLEGAAQTQTTVTSEAVSQGRASTQDFAAALQSLGPTPQERLAQEAKASENPITGKTRYRIGRNDPCWCGSGKKWKRCHFPDKGKR